MSRKFITICISLLLASSSYAVVIGNWESMPASGDGWVDWSTSGNPGIETLPAKYAAGTVGVTLGSQSVQLTQNGWNQSLSIKMQNNGLVDDFMANSKIEFDWAVPNLNDAGGWNNIEGITINSPAGWHGLASSTFSIGFWTGSGTQSRHIEIDYSAEKALIAPNPGWLELIITTNNDSVHNVAYFDNFQLTPEPATIAMLGLGGLALIRRKR